MAKLNHSRRRGRSDSGLNLAMRQVQGAKKGKIKVKKKEGEPATMKVKTKEPDRKYTSRIGSIGPGARGGASFHTP